MALCVKCPGEGVARLNGKDAYCRPCFLHYVTHRFRSTLGKRKIFSKKDEAVLVACSGGASSSALLDLIECATNAQDDKRLKVKATVLHLIERQSLSEDEFIKLRLNNSARCHVAYLSEVLYLNDFSIYTCAKESEQVPHSCDQSASNSLSTLLANIRTETSLLDIYKRLKLRALVKCAHRLSFDYLFTADSCSRLASDCLIDVSLGRGDQMVYRVDLVEKIPTERLLDHETESCCCSTAISSTSTVSSTTTNDKEKLAATTNSATLNLVRPLRDLDAKALALYDKFRNIQTFDHDPEEILRTKFSVNANSIQRETEEFVTGLCVRFPATVNTLISTASKLSCAKVSVGLVTGNSINRQTESSDPDVSETKQRNGDVPCSKICRLCFSSILQFDESFLDADDDDDDDGEETPFKNYDGRFCYGCKTALKDVVTRKKYLPPFLL